MDSTQLCRLCLIFSDDLVNVSDSFRGSTIASILTQHFWFKVDENDGSSKYVCEICWINVRTFHEFYKRIQWLRTKYSVNLAGVEEASSYFDLIKQENSDLIKQENPLELDFEYEEAELSEQIDLERIKEDSSSDSNDENRCTQSNDAQTLADEYRPPSKKRKADDAADSNVTRNHTRTPSIDSESGRKEDDLDESHHNSTTQLMSRSDRTKEKKEKAARIREFFNMKCEICNDDEFETLLQVRKHYRKIHNQIGYITCCGRRFYEPSKALKHIVNHCNPDAFRCDQCGKQCKTSYGLKIHVKNIHDPKSSRPFKCNLCSGSFVEKYTLLAHVRLCHTSKNEGPFTCDICKKDYASKFLLSCHIRVIHTHASSFICDICAKEYKSKPALVNHMYEHSISPRPKAQCNVCGVWLKHEESVKQHKKIFHDVHNTVFNCQICNKTLANKKELMYHTRQNHRNRRHPHPCTLCGKILKTAVSLKEHMAVHTGEELYSCMYCEKTFKSNGNMYTHRKKAHLDEWTRDKQNRYTIL